jgi:hypothetical protein
LERPEGEYSSELFIDRCRREADILTLKLALIEKGRQHSRAARRRASPKGITAEFSPLSSQKRIYGKWKARAQFSQPRTIRGESVRAINANVAVLLLISEVHLPVC